MAWNEVGKRGLLSNQCLFCGVCEPSLSGLRVTHMRRAARKESAEHLVGSQFYQFCVYNSLLFYFTYTFSLNVLLIRPQSYLNHGFW